MFGLRRFRRLRRRTRLILAAPTVLLLWAAAAFLARPAFVFGVAQRPYDQGHYRAAVVALTWLQPANLLEPWKAWFDRGTAWAAAGDYAAAIADLEEARDRTSRPGALCPIANNLAWSQEKAGDVAAGEAQVAYYEAALATLRDYAWCWTDTGAEERVESKLQEAGDGAADPGGDQDDNPGSSGQSRRDQLEEREQAAEQERQAQPGAGAGADTSGGEGEGDRW
jgi:tetratricopeptide (TPR) repeat protein